MTKILDQCITDDFSAYHGDNIEVIAGLPEGSIDLTVSSPPFPAMYVYSDSPRDIGNTSGIGEMLDHFRFLVRDLFRVTKRGRSCCIHLTNVPAFKHSDGYVGRFDFRGDVIRLFQAEGWIYASEVTVDKCPQVRAQRTKDRGLLFKSLGQDSSVMAPVMPDYILIFRKPGENPTPIRAGRSEKYGDGNGWITQDEWIEWAHAVWYHSRPGMAGGYRETDVLNVSAARQTEDERHLCPLALPLIERCVKLWSSPGEVVLDPFGGIFSTPYQAIKLGRKGVGVELKESYYRQGVRNCKRAVTDRPRQRSFLDDLEPEPGRGRGGGFVPLTPASARPLTPAQRAVFNWMVEYTAGHFYQPSFREVMEHFGFRSTNAITDYLAAFAERGLIDWSQGRGRGGHKNRAIVFLRREPIPEDAP